MKALIGILALLPLLVNAQNIPNSNFENWTLTGGLYNPDDWVSDNSANFQIIERDEDAYEGDYALKLIAQAIGVGDYGEVSTTFPVESIASSLDFYVRTNCEFGYVELQLTYFNNETEIIDFAWFSTETMSEWTPISMELDQIEPIFTHAEIKIVAAVGDFVPGNAEISIDGMHFNQTLSTSEPNSALIKIFPNPTSEILKVASPEILLSSMRLYSLDGKCVRSHTGFSNYLTLDVSDLNAGVYIVRVDLANGVVENEKVFINR